MIQLQQSKKEQNSVFTNSFDILSSYLNSEKVKTFVKPRRILSKKDFGSAALDSFEKPLANAS